MARARHLIAAALLMLCGQAMAQEPTGFATNLENVSKAGPEAQLDYVQGAVAEIQQAHGTISALLETAQASGDSKAVQCVSKRETDVKAMADASNRAAGKMVNYVESGDVSHAGHEFRMVAIAQQRTRQLLAEAERCVGGQELVDGQTSVQIIGYDEKNPFEFTDWLAVSETDVGFDPTDISPFR